MKRTTTPYQTLLTSTEAEQSGFTLVELLVASAIILVLSGLALQSFVIYRQNSYHAVAMQMMGQTRTSMEAGKIDSEKFEDELLFESNAPGPATEMDGQIIVPGLTLPQDFFVYVSHNPNCENAVCVEDYVVTRHCKSNQRVIYAKTYGLGATMVYNAEAADAC